MNARDVVVRKRDGGELDVESIEFFLGGLVEGTIPDYQASALLMAIFLRGMVPAERVAWTRAMLESGDRLSFPGIDRPLVDKHSTGGVGDKASIPLAPAVAACGAAVPMISGRGLGHTGGTLDKLESIPGFRTDLSAERFGEVLRATGCALGGQTERLVPADRILYALRDVTGTVESIPLVASSILSKKLAEGLDGLVLDVKFGSGAFFPDLERGEELARTLIEIAGGFGLEARALHTNMERPLGRAIGNVLEIRECLDCLEGGGPPDLRELVARLGGEMLSLVGLAGNAELGGQAIEAALDDGRARAVFAEIVEAQGGDPRCLDDRGLLPATGEVEVLRSPGAGRLGIQDVRELGHASGVLGGGRQRAEDPVDPAVGLVLLKSPGDPLEPEEPWLEIHHRGGRGLEEARRIVEKALELGGAGSEGPLVRAHFGPGD